MKIALALGGGGAKGSYQLGVFKALNKLCITPDIITGTSIGALNGALLTQGEPHILEELWANITRDQVFAPFDIQNISFDLQNLKRLTLRSDVKLERPLDVLPLKNLISSHLNEEKLRNSNIDFGLVCVSFPSLTPLELTLSDMPKGSICDYLIATSSVYPAFPMCRIDDKLHIDGGFYDNLPIDLAFSMGACKVIAVDLYTKPFHANYLNSPLVRYIKPSQNLGPMLKFDQATISRNIALGYNDTLKSFDRAYGFDYTFRKQNFETIQVFANKFCKLLHDYERNLPKKHVVARNLTIAPLTNILTSSNKLSVLEFFMRGAEICMDILKMSDMKIYDISEFNEFLISRFLNKERFEYAKLFKNLLSQTPNREYLLGCIYYSMVENGVFNDTIFWIGTLFPRETIGAFYLYSITQ